MSNKTIATIIVAALLGITMFTVKHTQTLNNSIKIKQIELKDNAAQLQLLDDKYQKLNENLNKTGADKAKLEKDLDNLQKEREQLQKDLQAKKDAKERDIASKAINAVGPQKAYAASGSCADWMAQAGVTDTANATWLIMKESGCNPNAVNRSSGACGIPQALPCSKLGTSDPVAQIRWMQTYVVNRYGSWAAAVAWHRGHNWY